jgi:hypothetical protein
MTKKHKQQAAPEFTTDADGQAIVRVSLANSQLKAVLYAEDYQRLMSVGFSRFWKYTEDGQGRGYPTLNAYTSDGHNREVPIARLIAQAGHGERVRVADGNTLNLRTENLSVYLGRAWYSADDWYPTATACRAAGVSIAEKGTRSPCVRQRASKGAGSPQKASPLRPQRATQGAGNTTPAGQAENARLSRTSSVTQHAPSEPRRTFAPRVVNRSALSARVRERMVEARPEMYGENFREGI